MNSIKKYSWPLLLVIAYCYSACKEKEIYPDIPSLEYKSTFIEISPNSFGTYDTLLGVVVSYKDGDGDIGLNLGDTFPPYDPKPDSLGDPTNPYYYNLIVDYREVINGKTYPLILPNTPDTFKVTAKISNLTPEGKFKAIRGDIEYKFFLPRNARNTDSIKVKVKIYDRALHPSNTVESPLIILP